jgi:hypothetical protein
MRKKTTEELLESLAILVLENGEKMVEGFAAVNKRLDSMDTRFSFHDKSFLLLNNRIDILDDDIKDIKRNNKNITGLLVDHEKRLGKVEFALKVT